MKNTMTAAEMLNLLPRYKKTGEIVQTRVNGMLQDLFNTGICRPKVPYGSGNYRGLHDETFAVRLFLDRNNIAYEFGNDAPRGGKTGDYFKLA